MVILMNGHSLIRCETELDLVSKNCRHGFPVIDGSQTLKKLNEVLLANNGIENINDKNKNKLFKTLNNINKEAMIKYCAIIIEKNYKNGFDMKDINKKIKLFQKAFIEMEALFIDEPRKQENKTGFHHLLGILEEIISGPNPTIEKCTIAILHDAVENVPGYTIDHVKNTYGEDISKSLENISKKPLDYYGDTKKDKTHLKKERQEDYYGNMSERGKKELNVKFADRLDSLKTMYKKDEEKKEIMDKNYLLKKLLETKDYFLIPAIKSKVDNFHYERLEKKYLERKEKLENQNLI
ncbi:MAG TPA: hypothetical protein VJ892_00680 [Candidatus Absconditabacterales bacterium]|nr:hypothetical protein [Candidatus Absconditabacterales bacterium]